MDENAIKLVSWRSPLHAKARPPQSPAPMSVLHPHRQRGLNLAGCVHVAHVAEKSAPLVEAAPVAEAPKVQKPEVGATVVEVP